MDKRIYVFGYGSLMNMSSLVNVVKRNVSCDEVIKIKLNGYERKWSVIEVVFSCELDRSINAVFLDIQRTLNSFVNGILIEINKEELANLKDREKNYDLVDITEGIIDFESSSRIYSFSSKKEFRVNQKDNDVYILEEYVNMVERGASCFGESFLDEYFSTTIKHNFPIISGKYLFVDPLQSSFV